MYMHSSERGYDYLIFQGSLLRSRDSWILGPVSYLETSLVLHLPNKDSKSVGKGHAYLPVSVSYQAPAHLQHPWRIRWGTCSIICAPDKWPALLWTVRIWAGGNYQTARQSTSIQCSCEVFYETVGFSLYFLFLILLLPTHLILQFVYLEIN